MSSSVDPDPSGDLEPIVSSRLVRASPSEAFTAFTEDLGSWWDPRLTPDATTFRGAEVEPRVGGDARFVHEGDMVDFTPHECGPLVTLWHGGWTLTNGAHRRKFNEWPQLLERFAAHVHE